MYRFVRVSRVIIAVLGVVLAISAFDVTARGLRKVSERTWDDLAVIRVLHVFAYGGFASDEQITIWADMDPELAIKEMLTFEAVNAKLSPLEDGSGLYGETLASLQEFWSSDSIENPVRVDKRRMFPLLYTSTNGATSSISTRNLQNTWNHAVITRGINPVLHKMGMFLTNHLMALSVHKMRAGLMRGFYDNTVISLSQGKNFFDLLGEGATSAAVARAYGHQYNSYNNKSLKFRGNDDFAREFYQLFFRIKGVDEDMDYHENITIEHTAWALTGMKIDYDPVFYGSTSPSDGYTSIINFTDHIDVSGRIVNNVSVHYYGETAGCLEILHETVCGSTAEDIVHALAQIAGDNQESLVNLPVYVIDFFADDRMSDSNKAKISQEWQGISDKNILTLLRNYAISTRFHHNSRTKFYTAFDRNLTIHNLNTLSNEETFIRAKNPIYQMSLEGAEIFKPLHDVFGSQTGMQAANNPNVFREAFSRNVNNPEYLGATKASYTDSSTGVSYSWEKDWGSVVPRGVDGYLVDEVAEWLWTRFTGRSASRGMDDIARAQIRAMLATGYDFGYLVDPENLERTYSSDDIANIYFELNKNNAYQLMDLDSVEPDLREAANERIGLAVNFITATPFVFAQEGK